MEAIPPKKTQWPDIESFINTTLRKEQEWSVLKEYPLAFEPRNFANIRIAMDDNNRIVSHAVLKPTVVKTPHHLFKVGVIGSVCTAETHRGQGFGKSVIESCLSAAKDQDCDLAMLWTDLFPFYEKMGFQGAGTEVHLNIPEGWGASLTPTRKILKSSKVSPQSLLSLFNQHSLRSFRTTEDIQRHLQIPNSEVFTAWSPATGTLEAYCVVGKGADFINYIHEWGGSVSSLLELVTHIRKDRKFLSLIAPQISKNLVRKMKDLGAQELKCNLGMIKITNPESFCKRIKKGARALGYKTFIFEHRDGVTYFGGDDEIYQAASLTDIVSLVFGPTTARDIYPFSDKTLEMLGEIFPIPFWIWGWDSI